MKIMQESDDENTNQSTDFDKKTRDKILENELRSFRNRGFHDGYDEGKKAVIQNAFDNGYQKAFEQNFILSTLKGVAQALIASHNLNSTSSGSGPTATTKITSTNLVTKSSTPSSSRPTSTTSSSSVASTSSPYPSNSSKQRIVRSSNIFGSSTTTTTSGGGGDISSSSSSSNVSNTTTGNSNINISSNHLSILESMNFDNANNIESIKNDLIKICRENRLEILAHYVSEIG